MKQMLKILYTHDKVNPAPARRSWVKADVVDIFSSIQGEGMFLGARQIFIRFKNCNLACSFCDEPRDSRPKEYSPEELTADIKLLEATKGPHHSVSLTGGEPLLYSPFLKIFLRLLKSERFKVYLETNGTLPGELQSVINLVDIIAMDFKLPSSSGQKPFWNEHLKFLKVARQKKVFVKAVITPDTVIGDIERCVNLIKEVNKNISLILQPATPVKPIDKKVDRNKLLEFLEFSTANELNNVRVIPQIHKRIGVK